MNANPRLVRKIKSVMQWLYDEGIVRFVDRNGDYCDGIPKVIAINVQHSSICGHFEDVSCFLISNVNEPQTIDSDALEK